MAVREFMADLVVYLMGAIIIGLPWLATLLIRVLARELDSKIDWRSPANQTFRGLVGCFLLMVFGCIGAVALRILDGLNGVSVSGSSPTALAIFLSMFLMGELGAIWFALNTFRRRWWCALLGVQILWLAFIVVRGV